VANPNGTYRLLCVNGKQPQYRSANQLKMVFINSLSHRNPYSRWHPVFIRNHAWFVKKASASHDGSENLNKQNVKIYRTMAVHVRYKFAEFIDVLCKTTAWNDHDR